MLLLQSLIFFLYLLCGIFSLFCCCIFLSLLGFFSVKCDFFLRVGEIYL